MSLSRAGAAVAALAVAAFCFGTTESLPIGLLPQISSGLHVSPSAVGLIVTGYGLVVAAASVPPARLTANVRRRRLLSVVMALFVAATVQHRHRRRRRAGRFDPFPDRSEGHRAGGPGHDERGISHPRGPTVEPDAGSHTALDTTTGALVRPDDPTQR